MLINASTQGTPRELAADVCIVGAGPAGLTLARELTRAGVRTCLLESGGPTHAAAGDELNRGAVHSPHGYRADTLREGRRRQLGGSSARWNHLWRGRPGRWVRYLPLDAIDFEARDWVPESGWPFSRAALLPFYDRARAICGLAPAATAAAREPGGPAPWELGRIESTLAHFGQGTPFLRDLPDALRRDERAHVILHATLQTLRLHASGDAVESADVRLPGGASCRVRAGAFVIAAGGLENARVLLLHDGLRRGGLGNAHGMVGRCFMDHPAVTLGTLRPSSPAWFDRAGFYDQRDGGLARTAVMGCLHIRPETMRRERLLNLSAALAPRLRDFHSNLAPMIGQFFAKGSQLLRERNFPRSPNATPEGVGDGASVWRRMLESYYSECFCGWSALRGKPGRFRDFRVRCLVEQSPDRANRVELDDDARDAHGQRKMRVVWRWHEPELRTLRRAQEIFRAEFAAAGVGEFVPEPMGADGVPGEFFSTHHFMGATRMHADPRQGVVDADGRVHGVENLFVAGSSVFPTAGFANPTLTVVALAVRLADHLRERARDEVEVAAGQGVGRAVSPAA